MKKLFAFLTAALVSVTMFATTYTVAGDSEYLFGTTWDPTNTANDMVLVESSEDQYQWVKSDVALPAGPFNFKVCEDYAWSVTYPANDLHTLFLSPAFIW